MRCTFRLYMAFHFLYIVVLREKEFILCYVVVDRNDRVSNMRGVVSSGVS